MGNDLNNWQIRDAINELGWTGVEWPSSAEALKELVGSHMDGWTMSCYELDTNQAPYATDATEPRPVPLRRSWVLVSGYEVFVSTVFLGLDHRFGRPDKGDKPILFETIAMSPEGHSLPRRCVTYEEAKKMHQEVCELVADKNIRYQDPGKYP